MQVRVRDNGLRCFVPPCYSWDVFALDGTKLGTVAQLVDDLGNVLETVDSDAVHEAEFSSFDILAGAGAAQVARALRILRSAPP